ncbi:hypothetical protein B0O44_1133 [Pedobacter nutrimenti]|uniref:Uncharacterized protein n=1 Tax=Pedobacter nutrimenti TaxID=1241337 RepID=A0A318U639_9SPHI|nr:hypothetical protein B0O44_1133 [Pedobacter nutrimenti]
MEHEYMHIELTGAKISDSIRQFEKEKEQRFIQLIVDILVMSILKEYHEESNQIPKI